jgi:2,3,4,5-tetrahydropyridine-2-carboxylate N-succinyltransferase
MGVFIGQSTRIYDRATEILRGRGRRAPWWCPARLPWRRQYSLYCGVIVKRVDAQTRAKISINEFLRSADSA